jgi:hypothetical protein
MSIEITGQTTVNTPKGVTAGTLPAPATTLALTPGAPGNFTVAHGLGKTPVAGIVQMTSGGSIYWQAVPWDATNVYLTATDAGITANLLLWTTA